MTAQELLSLATELVFLGVFVMVLRELLRTPNRAQLDAFLFFAAIAAQVSGGTIARLAGVDGSRAFQAFSFVVISLLPYFLLRLADDFQPQPRLLMLAAPIVAIAVAIVGVVVPPPWQPPVLALPIGLFVLVGGYSSVVFLRGAQTTAGVTQRRMQAVAIGAGLVALVLLLAFVSSVLPQTQPVLSVVDGVLTLVAAIAFAAGFATPRFLRRAWQGPVLRSLLADAPSLPQLESQQAVVRRLEAAATEATGAAGASIGVWQQDTGLLRYYSRDGELFETGPDQLLGGRTFTQQRPLISHDAERDDPEHAEVYRRVGAAAVLAAPMTSGSQQLGVLTVYLPRAPFFPDEDLAMVALLAEHATLILRAQELVAGSARVQAREEAARLKEDFLSAVAHDVRTPLTTITLNAELMGRRLGDRAGDDPFRRHTTAILANAKRLNALVSDYLDMSRLERGGLSKTREIVDLAEIAAEVCADHASDQERLRVVVDEPASGRYDRVRIHQLLDNLVGNAIKYSPDGGEIVIRVWRDEDYNHLSVTDKGIGIPSSDVPALFTRFQRASNVDDRQFHGLGLGLFIARQIAEEHGGSIEVTSEIGLGSTFHASLAAS